MRVVRAYTVGIQSSEGQGGGEGGDSRSLDGEVMF